MGNSHFDSNVLAKNGDETIRGFATISAAALTATNVTVNTAATGCTYLKLGAMYIFSGAKQTEATIVANATKITASAKGSIYLSSTGGSVWVFRSNTTASVIPMV
jgi:hypothetical protein